MKRKEVVLFQRLGLTFSRRVSNYRAAYLQEKLNKAITQKQKKKYKGKILKPILKVTEEYKSVTLQKRNHFNQQLFLISNY